MTEDDARTWLTGVLGVSRETFERLDRFQAMVIAENARQNLISASSIPYIWARHIVDSAQLLPLSDSRAGAWLDLGTGAGFPGFVIAILRAAPITLVDSRRRRVDFLRESAARLGLDHVTVELCQIESLNAGRFDVISARAFAALPRIFALAERFSTEKTLWLLPKGRSAHAELESVAESWHGMFHVKHSVTDPDAHILVGTRVSLKRHR